MNSPLHSKSRKSGTTLNLRVPLWGVALSLASGLPGCATLPPAGNPNSPAEVVSTDRYETVVVFATGNIQGALLAPQPNQGGASALESYYKILAREFGSQVLWLDAGKIQGQAFEYSFDQGESFKNYLSKSGIQVTLDQRPTAWTLAPQALQANQESREIQFLEPAQAGLHSLKAGRLQVDVISAKTTEELTEQSVLARKQGAQIVIWLTDLPIYCSPSLAHNSSLLHKSGEARGFCEGSLHEVLKRAPEGTIQAVITSGIDRDIQHYIYPQYSSNSVAGIPVVAAAPYGLSAHLIYLTYDLKSQKIVSEKTRIEGPIETWSKTPKDLTTTPPSWTKAHFHGKTIRVVSELQPILKPLQSWNDTQEKTILGQSKTTLEARPQGESSFANLVADAIREGTQADFALVHPGLVKRATDLNIIHPGPITAADLDRVIPAQAPVAVIPVSGDELKTLVRISENGSRGFAAVSGLNLRLIDPHYHAPATDLDGDHHLSHWEQNRLLSISDLEERSLHTTHRYRLAVPLYLIEGGDDWRWASNRFNLTGRIDRSSSPRTARELVAEYIKKRGSIEAPLKRIQFEQPRSKARKRSHRRRLPRRIRQ